MIPVTCPCTRNFVVPGRKKCGDCLQTARDRYWTRRNLGLCKRCPAKAVVGQSLCIEHRNRALVDLEEIRSLVYRHYGNRCKCCGERNWLYLTLDHILSNGKQQRSESNTKGGLMFFRWVIKQGFPDDLQILCANCHIAKTRKGVCHERTN